MPIIDVFSLGETIIVAQRSEMFSFSNRSRASSEKLEGPRENELSFHGIFLSDEIESPQITAWICLEDLM
jgi:hypothetical protein